MLIKIASTTDIPAGQMRAFEAAGTRLNVANEDGTFYAIDDTCTHMGCSLARGRLAGRTVTCACHGSQFDVTSGEVLRGPAQRPVRPYRVSVNGTDVLADVGE